jgi:uncharacterized glyoxalase superfamily protein PhnB
MFLADPQFRAARGNAGPTVIWLNLDSIAAVNELHRRWSADGARVVAAPESKPWGLHECTVADPDGNLLRVFHDFATPERERRAAVPNPSSPPQREENP